MPLNDGTGLSIYQNVGEVDGEGLELVLKWKPLPNITIDSHATFNHIKSTGGSDLQDYPENMFYVAANWDVTAQTVFNLSVKYIGERARIATDPRSPLDAYIWMTGQVTWNISHKLSAAFLVQNLTNADAREPSLYSSGIPGDLPHPGRQSKLEFRYNY